MITDFLKRIARDWPFYDELRNWEVKRRWPGELARWERCGSPIPPPHLFKQNIIREHAKRFGPRVFIETGTCYGDMVEALRREFDRVYSIELSPYLFGKVSKRFKRAKNVTLIQGDSGVKLKEVMPSIGQPALFYLDGHYSSGMSIKGEKETPICEELHTILRAKPFKHVILIDDARCFGVDPDYPPVDELRKLVDSYSRGYSVAVKDDCIRITP
jgi:hypothetical protein